MNYMPFFRGLLWTAALCAATSSFGCRAIAQTSNGDRVNAAHVLGGENEDAGIARDSMNLALQKNGCWVVASSNADFGGLYSSNLVDGDPSTSWRSFQPTKEEYVDLKWDFEVSISSIRVLQEKGSQVSRIEVYYWFRDRWNKISGRSLRSQDVPLPVEFRFPTIRSKRIRLLFKNDSPRHTALTEIQAFGPEQPVLRLDNGRDWSDGAWSYHPASRFDHVVEYYKSLASGKPIAMYEGQQESVVLESVETSPGNVKPGGGMRLRLRLRPAAQLDDDYVLVATIGERERLYFHADYSIARVILPTLLPTSRWPAVKTQTIDANIYIPVYAPHGGLDVMIHAISLSGRPPLRLLDGSGKEIEDGRAAVINIRRFARDPSPDPRAHTAKIDASNGTLLSIDGKKVVPYLFTPAMPSFEQFHYYSKATGIKIFQLQVYPYAINTGDYRQRNCDFVAQHVRNLLRVVPDAYVIIQMDMRTRADWWSAHPEGCLQTADGRPMHESFCSREYRDEAIGYITHVVKFVQSQPWGNRVIGYNLETGEPEGTLSGRGEVVGDYNPQAIEAFREFLRGKYGNSTERLRQAFADTQVTFETVYPTPEKINARGAGGGVILDPATQRLAIDYHEFLSSLVPRFVMEQCAGTVKRLTGGRALVGTYGAYLWASLGVDNYTHQANHFYTSRFLESPNVDFFASPSNYTESVRHAGGAYRPNQPYHAIRLNGKLHINECDQRTFRSGTRVNYCDRSREETLAVLKRDLGTAVMQGTGAWFADWSNNYSKDRSMCEPFFLDEEILKQIQAFNLTYRRTANLKRGGGAQVAVFISGASGYYLDNNAGPATNTNFTFLSALARAGAPYDELLLEDISKPEVRDGYKCFIFLNACYMTEEQRVAVQSLKRDGKTLVWVYAPGYARDSGLSARNIEELTGFEIAVDHNSRHLTYRPASRLHPIVRGLDDMEYEGYPAPVSPWFYITDTHPSVRILGRYPDNRTAVAARDYGDYKSVYFCAPIAPVQMLSNLLRYAGCHIYVDQDIYLDATRDFLLLTNSYEGKRSLTVSLPRKCDVLDALTGDRVARDTGRFDLEMKPGETLFLRLRSNLAEKTPNVRR